MLRAEADWIGKALCGFERERLSPVLHIGSSTETFRTRDQPWIDELVFAPLVRRGIDVVHADMKDDDGVDIVADVTTDEGFRRLVDVQPRAIFLFNILEHVIAPKALCASIESLSSDGGLIMVTVPRSYPYHRDPIDTMFRPDPETIAALFPKCRMVLSEVVAAGSLSSDVKKKPRKIVSLVLKALIPVSGFHRWTMSVQKLKWLFVDYKVSCVVLQKMG